MLPLYAFMAWTERVLSVVLFSLLSFPCLFPVLSSNILSNLISGVLYFCTFLRLIHRASHFCRTVDTVVIYLCIYLFIYIYIHVLQHLFETLLTRNRNVERFSANSFSLCLAPRILSISTRWKFVSFKRTSFISPGKEPLMLVVSVTRWIPCPVYTLWRRLEISYLCWESSPEIFQTSQGSNAALPLPNTKVLQ